MSSSPLGALPLFAKVAPYINVDKVDRVELSTKEMDPQLVESALAITLRCCHCGSTIHPFRRRASTPERAAASTGPIFVSLVCPMSIKPGCARGRAADEAKTALILDIAFARSKPHPPMVEPEEYAGDPEWLADFLAGLN